MPDSEVSGLHKLVDDGTKEREDGVFFQRGLNTGSQIYLCEMIMKHPREDVMQVHWKVRVKIRTRGTNVGVVGLKMVF